MTAFERTPAPKKDRIEKPIDPHYAEPTSVDPTLLEESGTDITERLHALIDEAETDEPTALEDKNTPDIHEDLSYKIELLREVLVPSGNANLSVNFNATQIRHALDVIEVNYSAEDVVSKMREAFDGYDIDTIAKARLVIKRLNKLKKLDKKIVQNGFMGQDYEDELKEITKDLIDNKGWDVVFKNTAYVAGAAGVIISVSGGVEAFNQNNDLWGSIGTGAFTGSLTAALTFGFTFITWGFMGFPAPLRKKTKDALKQQTKDSLVSVYNDKVALNTLNRDTYIKEKIAPVLNDFMHHQPKI